MNDGTRTRNELPRLNKEATKCEKNVLRHNISERTYLIVVMPKDVLGWFGTELNDARQVDMTTDVNVKLWSA